MWLATKYGFFSIVQKQASDDEPAAYHVRARVREDLENLLVATALDREILEWPTADYRYRMTIAQEGLFHLMCLLAENLDYSNFKSMIGDTPDQRGKLHAYHDIWHTMTGLQK